MIKDFQEAGCFLIFEVKILLSNKPISLFLVLSIFFVKCNMMFNAS